MKLGIDFGTSFSVPATVYLGNKIILMPGIKYGIPSLFFYSRDEGVLIGDEAEDAGQGNNARFLKREIKLSLASEHYIDNKLFTAEDIVSHILKYIEEVAVYTSQTKLLSKELEGIVLSVPASFTNNEKELIKRAFEKSIIPNYPYCKFLGFIKEPVAAAISYFETSLEDDTSILVFDLGGGTCDVAIVRSNSQSREKYDVIDSEMIRVGGKDWDDKIAQYISTQLEKSTGLNLANDQSMQEKIKRAAINAKHSFSERGIHGFKEKVRIHVDVRGSSESILLTKTMFDELTMPLAQQTINLVKKVVSRNNNINISKLICVGGGSNMPQVIDRIKNEFPQYDINVYEPEKSIAFGAAFYAANCKNESYLQDRSSLSYGIRCYEDYDNNPNKRIIVNIIKKGDSLPKSNEHSFLTVEDNQTSVAFHVFESNSSDNEYEYCEWMNEKYDIMKITLELPKGCPKETETHVKMTLNKDGLLEISARDNNNSKVTAKKQLNF